MNEARKILPGEVKFCDIGQRLLRARRFVEKLAIAASYLSPGLTRHFPGKLRFPASAMVMTPEQIAIRPHRRVLAP